MPKTNCNVASFEEAMNESFSLPQRVILVVDDIALIRATLIRKLKNVNSFDGVTILTAKNRAEAEELFNKFANTISDIFLDLNMPDRINDKRAGYLFAEFVANFSKESNLKQPRIICISDHAHKEDVQNEFDQYGVKDFLGKVFNDENVAQYFLLPEPKQEAVEEDKNECTSPISEGLEDAEPKKSEEGLNVKKAESSLSVLPTSSYYTRSKARKLGSPPYSRGIEKKTRGKGKESTLSFISPEAAVIKLEEGKSIAGTSPLLLSPFFTRKSDSVEKRNCSSRSDPILRILT